MNIAEQLVGFLVNNLAFEDTKKGGVGPEPVHILNDFIVVVNSDHIASQIAMRYNSGNFSMKQFRRSFKVSGRLIYSSIFIFLVKAQSVNRLGIFPESVVRIFILNFHQKENNNAKSNNQTTNLYGGKQLLFSQTSDQGF